MHDWSDDIRRHLEPLSLPPEREAEIVEELSQHLNDCVRELTLRGVSLAEARVRAVAELEDSGGLKRALRDVEPVAERDPVPMGGGGPRALWPGISQDLRYAVRKLRRSPGFTLVAVTTLAVAIGATTAMFSIVNAVLLKPLPFRDPGQLVRVASVRNGQPSSMSYLDFADFRSQSRAVPAMAAIDVGNRNLTFPNASPLRLTTGRVSASFFEIIGVHPILGRAFAGPDDSSGAAPVVLLSEGLWRTSFGGDSTIVGRTVQLNAKPVTVIGVTPSTIDYPSGIDAWIPLVPTSDDLDPGNRGAHYLRGIGRLAPGATLDGAKAELAAIARRLEQQYPAADLNRGETAIPLRDAIVGSVHSALLVMLACVGFVLLIACANVANLLLVRASGRESEIAVRVAMGAGRARIMRQLVTESVLLSAAGAAVGTALAAWIVSLVHSFGPASVPRLGEVTVDGRVLAFATIVAIATGVLFGLVPAIHAARTDLSHILRESARGAGGRRTAQRTRGALVVVEMALAVVLLVGAGLLGRSFLRLLSVDPGYRPESVVTMSLSLPSKKYPWDADQLAFAHALIEQLRSMPGTQDAALAFGRPLAPDAMRVVFTRDDQPRPQPGQFSNADVRFVTDGFFRTLGMRIVNGRGFAEADRAGAPGVLVVSQEFARKFFPGESPVGKKITLGYGWQRSANKTDTASVRGEIIGVAGDIKAQGAASEPLETIYVPYAQTPITDVSVLVRSTAAPAAVINLARARIKEIDPDLPVFDAMPMSDAISESVAQPRFYAVLLGSFAAVALLLAAIGIYGVISYTMSQRTRELGIRIALGASRGGVTRLVVGHGMTLAAAGIAAGLAGAYALTRFLSTLLFGVGAIDAPTFIVVAAVLLGVAWAASWIPARRAARVDPLIAMRAE